MPLPMVHLAVAYALKDEAFAAAPAAYFLGALAPDSIHKREGWTRKDKDVSHLRNDLPIDERRGEAHERRILELWESRTGNIEKDAFIAGYCVHLLTDRLWSSLLQDPYFGPRYVADPAPAQDRRTAYYNDSDLADLDLYTTRPWRPEVFSLLAGANGIGLEGIVSAEETERWRDYVLNFFDNMDMERYIPAQYILPEDITRFVDESAPLILKKLN